MSSKYGFVTHVRGEGKVTIPSELREQLNLQQGDLVEVSIHKPEWYEMLDWSQMSASVINYSALPNEARNYISATYSCDSSGVPWRKQDV